MTPQEAIKHLRELVEAVEQKRKSMSKKDLDAIKILIADHQRLKGLV